MDCLYSQFVNEWALPLEKGPEAITRLSAWLHGDPEKAKIPFPVDGLWVHCPIEVRVSNSAINPNPRPFLDNTCHDGPTLYLNATLYRPYLRDPPAKERYYEAFEWLMREMGAKPHWAKNFKLRGGRELHEMYGRDMDDWLKVRREVDPDGMFLGEWHRRNLPLVADGEQPSSSILPLLEREKGRRKFGLRGAGDGIEWIGDRRWQNWSGLEKGKSEGSASPSPLMTSTSEESFDVLSSGEANIPFPNDTLM